MQVTVYKSLASKGTTPSLASAPRHVSSQPSDTHATTRPSHTFATRAVPAASPPASCSYSSCRHERPGPALEPLHLHTSSMRRGRRRSSTTRAALGPSSSSSATQELLTPLPASPAAMSFSVPPISEPEAEDIPSEEASDFSSLPEPPSPHLSADMQRLTLGLQWQQMQQPGRQRRFLRAALPQAADSPKPPPETRSRTAFSFPPAESTQIRDSWDALMRWSKVRQPRLLSGEGQGGWAPLPAGQGTVVSSTPTVVDSRLVRGFQAWIQRQACFKRPMVPVPSATYRS